MLIRVDPSPVIELNRAAAIAMRDGPVHGLALIDMILVRGGLTEYHLRHAARADPGPLVRRLRRCPPAIPTGAAIYDCAPLVLAAFASDGFRLAPPREHDPAARPAPPVPTRTPLVPPIPCSVACRSVASGGKLSARSGPQQRRSG